MNDLLARIKDTLIAKWEEFQESPLYSQLKERYDSLSPVGQKSILWAGLIFFLFIVFMIPNAFLTSAGDSITVFEEKKDQAQELLQVTQTSKSLPPLPPRMDGAQLKVTLNARLQEAGLTPEQIKGVNERAGRAAANELIPASVVQNIVDVELGQLNIKQMVEIEFAFSKISPLVKIVAADVIAHPSDNHYYDVKYAIASFNVNETEKEALDVKGKASKTQKPKSFKGKPTDSEGEEL